MSSSRPPSLRLAGRLVALGAFAFIALATLSPSGSPAPTVRGFCIVCGGVGGVDAVLNLLLFMPLGFGLGLLGWSGRRAFMAVVATTVVVELLQLTVVPGRDPSGGDVVMNSLGGAIGYWAAATLFLWARPRRGLAAALAIGGIIGWLATQALGAFAVAPSLSERPWYGHARRPLPPFHEYERNVRLVTLGGRPLPFRRFDPTVARAVLLGGDASIHATLVPGPEPRGTAAIYRITDDRTDEMLLLARRGDALVFRLRSRAVDLRLRQPTFLMRGAFGPAPGGDRAPGSELTLVTAHVMADRVALASSRGGIERSRSIRLSASWTWALVMPFTVALGTAAGMLGTVLWLGGLLVPVGYWARHALRGCARTSAAMAAAAGMGTLLLGLCAIPAAFGMRCAATHEWLAGGAGLAVGWLIARHTRRETATVRARGAGVEEGASSPLSVA